MTDYDVIVVGGGHNGLVCSAYLAKSGRKVLVLEANDVPGGAASTREFSPGYSVSGCANWLYQLNPDVVDIEDRPGQAIAEAYQMYKFVPMLHGLPCSRVIPCIL